MKLVKKNFWGGATVFILLIALGTFFPEEPSLTLTTDGDQETTDQTYKVKGEAISLDKIVVNGEEAKLSSDGSEFTKIIPLVAGTNPIKVEGYQDGAAVVTKEFAVYFDLEGKLYKEKEAQLKKEDEAARTDLNLTPDTGQKDNLYKVASISDGDTIRLYIDGKSVPVRLLAIDTPETRDPRKPVQCFGDKASQKLSELIAGKYVRAEVDPTQGDKDKYNRLLRYIYLEDGTNVNAEMVKQGYAFAYTRFPTAQLEDMRKFEQEARDGNKGLWGSCEVNESGSSKSSAPIATP